MHGSAVVTVQEDFDAKSPSTLIHCQLEDGYLISVMDLSPSASEATTGGGQGGINYFFSSLQLSQGHRY